MYPFFEKHGVEEKDYFSLFQLRNYRFPLHFHRAFEIIYVNEGQLNLSVNGKSYRMQKEDLAFIFPNQMHEFDRENHSEITVILFSPEWIGDFYLNYKGYIPDHNVMHSELQPDVEAMNSVYGRKSYLYGICAKLISQTSFSEVQPSPQAKVLYQILSYVEQHFAEDCTLKAVAEHLRYDYPYLSKLFIRLMNMSFTDYLNHYRISQACYLLKNSGLSIGEVASYCGYHQLRSFHRNFGKIIGKSPKQYRAVAASDLPKLMKSREIVR